MHTNPFCEFLCKNTCRKATIINRTASELQRTKSSKKSVREKEDFLVTFCSR